MNWEQRLRDLLTEVKVSLTTMPKPDASMAARGHNRIPSGRYEPKKRVAYEKERLSNKPGADSSDKAVKWAATAQEPMKRTTIGGGKVSSQKVEGPARDRVENAVASSQKHRIKTTDSGMARAAANALGKATGNPMSNLQRLNVSGRHHSNLLRAIGAKKAPNPNGTPSKTSYISRDEK